MRKIILLISALIGIILLSQFISAKIIINSPPEELYSLGDVINIPVKIATSVDLQGVFNMILICNGIETKFLQMILFLKPEQKNQLTLK
jgi:hypothetical protein